MTATPSTAKFSFQEIGQNLSNQLRINNGSGAVQWVHQVSGNLYGWSTVNVNNINSWAVEDAAVGTITLNITINGTAQDKTLNINDVLAFKGDVLIKIPNTPFTNRATVTGFANKVGKTFQDPMGKLKYQLNGQTKIWTNGLRYYLRRTGTGASSTFNWTTMI